MYSRVGSCVGKLLGSRALVAIGCCVGCVAGTAVGILVGTIAGIDVRLNDGCLVGTPDGMLEGKSVRLNAYCVSCQNCRKISIGSHFPRTTSTESSLY